MNNEVIITCAVTGAGDTVGRHSGVPVTPAQVAEAAIEAARAGAAVAHVLAEPARLARRAGEAAETLPIQAPLQHPSAAPQVAQAIG